MPNLMQRMLKPLALLSLTCLVLLSGCSLLTFRPDRLQPPLLPPADFPFNGQFTQVVSADAEPAKAMLASWSVQQGVLVLVGLTATGQELLRVRYDGQQLEEKRSPLLPQQLQAHTMLAQIQLAYWPLASIRTTLAGTGWSLQALPGVRRLYYDAHLVYEFKAVTAQSEAADSFWTQLLIEIPDLQQRIRIDTLEMDK
ncbi:DUF3261 domain-containing protein [Oceanobacter antarcticus]|uniref:DUF3261 domain-containing protein n=1 Tax=Oceanobacter antarcticus TaxID=3133425 RepID=A0ABW8NLY4_9GAMM